MPDNHQGGELESLRDRLNSARARRGDGRDGETDGRSAGAMGSAARVAIDFVAAIAVGVVIGLAIDYWFDFRPWGLIIFFVLGAAAGMMNVYRIAAGHDMAVGYRDPQSENGNNASEPNNKN